MSNEMLSRRETLTGAAACAVVWPALADTAPTTNWRALADDVRAQMQWAWQAYAARCFGQDQIKPVSGGADAFFFPKGPPLGLTIVEALDTLYVMGLDKEV